MQKASFIGGMSATGGVSRKVAGHRDILVKFHDGEIKNIKNILNVLGIQKNLLFVGKIANQGYNLDFTSNKITITKKNTKEIFCYDS